MNRHSRGLFVICLAVVALAFTDAGAREAGGPVTIRWPSREFLDLQAAIDAAPDGATIQIRDGVYRIDAPLFVRGKRLVIKGAGSGRTRPFGRATHLIGPPPRPVVDDRGQLALFADQVQGLWNLVGAGGVIQDMKLTGFDAAIVSTNGERAAGPTDVSNVVIADTGRGILSLSSSDLTVKNSTIMNTLWHGISVAPTPLGAFPTPKLTVNAVAIGCLAPDELTFASESGAGIYFANAFTAIDGAGVFGKCSGGIVGFQSSSFIVNSVLVGNRKAGILLQGGFSAIENNVILSTDPVKLADGSEAMGDGIMLVATSAPMTANLFDNDVVNSARAGVSAFGAAVGFADNFILCSAIDIFAASHGGFQFVLDDQGGNQCGCGQPETCTPKGEGLDPPPPIGGLE